MFGFLNYELELRTYNNAILHDSIAAVAESWVVVILELLPRSYKR